MFTGIVEEIGSIRELQTHDTSASGGSGWSATVVPASSTFLDGALLGDSIAINGTCLTITELILPFASPLALSADPNASPEAFKVGIAPETLRRTNLGSLAEGSRVNLERAVQASTRMGGHFVQGHVDTTARIIKRTPDGNAIVFRLQPRDPAVLRYVVEKGYIGLDGASLTVTAVSDGNTNNTADEGTTTDERQQEEAAAKGWWEVMMIAYTQDKVVMGAKQVGDEVNVEVDMVGKYVEKSLAGWLSEITSSSTSNTTSTIGNTSSDTISSKSNLRALVEKIVDEKLAQAG